MTELEFCQDCGKLVLYVTLEVGDERTVTRVCGSCEDRVIERRPATGVMAISDGWPGTSGEH